ncbi:MAG: hypothetical protein ACLFOY_01515 [Desulfatibacillaceae bacterium]
MRLNGGEVTMEGLLNHHPGPRLPDDDGGAKRGRDYLAPEDFQAGAGGGTHIENMRPFVDFVLENMVRETRIINGEAMVPSPDRAMVGIASHGPLLAWIPLMAVVAKYLLDNNLGHLIGGMYPHRLVFLLPGAREFYRRILGTPTGLDMDSLVESLRSGRIHITGTAPEGAYCNLAYDDYVAPFQTRGMIAAAIKAGSDMCLLAHVGGEAWNRRLTLPFGWKVPLTKGLRGVNITLPPLFKAPGYAVLCRRYTPFVTAEDMERAGRRQARRLLAAEAERIRAELNGMTDELRILSGGAR